MTYTIEKGIPIPENLKRESKYPFKLMEVNDSFVAQKHQAGTIRAAASYYKRRFKMKFMVVPIDTDQVRVWRVE